MAFSKRRPTEAFRNLGNLCWRLTEAISFQGELDRVAAKSELSPGVLAAHGPGARLSWSRRSLNANRKLRLRNTPLSSAPDRAVIRQPCLVPFRTRAVSRSGGSTVL